MGRSPTAWAWSMTDASLCCRRFAQHVSSHEPLGAGLEGPEGASEPASICLRLVEPMNRARMFAASGFESAQPDAHRSVDDHGAAEHGPPISVRRETIDQRLDRPVLAADDRKVSKEREPEARRPTGPLLFEDLYLGSPAFGSFDVTGVGREECLIQHPVRIALLAQHL